MFGFGSSKRATVPIADRAKLVGIDMTSTRVRALAVAGGHSNLIPLDSSIDELFLFINLEPRIPEIGLSGHRIIRKHPHLVCTNFLPQLGQTREWRGSRVRLTPESALQTAFEKIRGPITAETDGGVLTLPSYLIASQIKSVREIAARSKIPFTGTASAPMAIASHRARQILNPPSVPDENTSKESSSWIVPIRPQSAGPGDVMIIDVDDYALSATAINIQQKEVRLTSRAVWPRLSLKLWKDRLIDALSDRCVRLCRRDPRDSAAAEQALYEQLDSSMERSRQGRTVTLTVRSEKWYQDLVQQPLDFEEYCAGLIGSFSSHFSEFMTNSCQSAPPRAIWLTDAAANLPGLGSAVFQLSSENTEVSVLPPDAAAEAAAALHAHWMADRLPRVHLEGVIAVETLRRTPETRIQKSV